MLQFNIRHIFGNIPIILTLWSQNTLFSTKCLSFTLIGLMVQQYTFYKIFFTPFCFVVHGLDVTFLGKYNVRKKKNFSYCCESFPHPPILFSLNCALHSPITTPLMLFQNYKIFTLFCISSCIFCSLDGAIANSIFLKIHFF